MANKSYGFYLSWQGVGCSVLEGACCGCGGREKVILDDCTGYVKPGESLAIIGGSGAGKTTLVDILAGHKSVGKLRGQILVNGYPITKEFKERAGYVAAETVHIATLTVWETLCFTANIRLPTSMSKQDKLNYVEKLVDRLGLAKSRDSPVGDELIRGLSTGEKKRLDIAVELLAQPKMLFLDEPTSGLDAFAALNTMQLVFNETKAEKIPLIAIIHQPSASVFNMFDKVLLLSHGQTVFFGSLADCNSFFGQLGIPVPANTNSLDHYLNIIAKDTEEVASLYASSEYKQAVTNHIQNITGHLASTELYSAVDESKSFYRPNFFVQVGHLLDRLWKRYIRNPTTSWGRLIICVLLALVYGIIFFQLGNDLPAFRNRANLAAFLGFLPSFTAATAVPQFLEDRELFFQEFPVHFYNPLAYYISYWVMECGFNITMTMIQIIIIYFMAGFDAGLFGPYFGMCILQSGISVGVSQFTATFSTGLSMAFTLSVVFQMISYFFSSVSANLKTIPEVLRWINVVDYWKYTVQYLLYVQVYGFKIDCSKDTLKIPRNNTELVLAVGTGAVSTVNGIISPNATNPAVTLAAQTALLQAFALSTVSSFINSTTFAALNPALPKPVITDLLLSAQNHTGAILFAGPYLKNTTSTAAMMAEFPAKITAAVGGFFWDMQRVLAVGYGTDLYPDETRCIISDTKFFLGNKYGLADNIDNSTFGIAFAFLIIYPILAFIGLLVSRHYRKR